LLRGCRGRIGIALALLAMTRAAPSGAATPADREADAWFQSGRATVAAVRTRVPGGAPARNLVLLVGDGMGPSTVTAGRILEGQLRGESGEENRLSFERLPHVALAKTYNTDQQVPDSAGTMTAIISGVKTRAGVLGIDEQVTRGDHEAALEHRVPTLFEEAERRGMVTGIVTTTSVTHATPAACYAHSPDREWENDSLLSHGARKADFPDLARQLIEFDAGDGIEAVLGGGRQHFLPANAMDPEEPELHGQRWDERDLPTEWLARHPDGRFVWNASGLAALDPRARRLLGLFDPGHMEFEATRAEDPGGEPSLSEMTRAALDILGRHDKPFVLMVEGGRIDHGHHAGNAHRALLEVVEFARAAQVVLDTVDLADTLVVVTADHSHPLTISGYPVRGNPILGKVMENDPQGEGDRLARDGLGLPYTTLGYPLGPGYGGASSRQEAGPKRFPHIAFRSEPASGRPDLSEVDTGARDYLQETAVPRFTETHSGEDVAVYAGGPRANLFQGVIEQHVLYHAMVEALGWNAAPPGAGAGLDAVH
jgi:alkaline phosphatase